MAVQVSRFGPRVWIFLIAVSLIIVVAYAVYAASLSDGTSTTASASLGSLSQVQSGTSPLVGKQVPTFSLPELTVGAKPASGKVSPSNFAGHPLVINFFASWCTACQAETPMVASVAQELGHKVDFLGIDENDTDKAKALAFIAKDHVTYPVATDHASLQGKYLLIGLPTTVFVRASGKVVGVVQGQMTRQVLDHWITRIE
ncbi:MULTISPECIES: TlpA family protein disulfide reductase [Ferrimicrobium]|jgi:cytochrome c biogenesis protein CcmG/thiol:disulfide interchange protein DsbE|uniref:TlpA family protein disulfide reductase n=1 Tax=Ferrimicrobium acidiphilum TaxID=121039 RepID=A0ABV3Y1A4_9ACTN|nr:TlpA disulfide reductase family protein [Ferrimicrobium sp.]MCL5973896.1 TlpA family protein disulfide reductase [Actinomycetota bacterium]